MTRSTIALVGSALVGLAVAVGAIALLSRTDADDGATTLRSTDDRPTVTRTVTVQPTVTVTLPPPPPLVAFGDGLYLVGADVTPGEYRSDGPDDASGRCYWARLTSSDGTSIITNSITAGPSRLTAVAGEYLEVSGCAFYAA